MRLPLCVLIALLVACGPTAPSEMGPPPPDDRSYVVMVSFDGMRHDFLERTSTPNFDRVAARGVRAEALIPGYPSKTFPNHYTLATGLYPAHHGLVDNAFYDPSLDAMYRLGDASAVQDGRWYGGEPIWVTAETQGIKAASYFWVGSEAEIDGVRPTYYREYDGSVPFETRIDGVLDWLSLPQEARPGLVMLYFNEPDHTAHELGPDDPAIAAVVGELDDLLGQLLDGLAALPHGDRVHVVLVSDHGMAPVPEDRVVYLDDFVDLEGVRLVGNTTQALLYFDGDTARRDSVYRTLREDLVHATAYLPAETPERWHYQGTDRIGDLIVAAEPGWIVRLRDWRPWGGGGMHGWDPFEEDMRGIFLAAGPEIVPSPTIPAFENVHVYPLVARLLGLEPAAGIDGSLDVLRGTLAEPEPALP